MRFAEEEITVTVDGERIHLRPSLRAAFRLERRYGGFPALLGALEEGRLSVLSDMIEECGGRRVEIFGPGLAATLVELIPPLQRLALALMGLDDAAEENGQAEASGTGQRVTFAEHHARLFRLGTGWLGWTPAETWSATPLEIKHAYEGKLEMLEAIGFLTRADKPAEKAGSLDDKFLALMAHNATLSGATTA